MENITQYPLMMLGIMLLIGLIALHVVRPLLLIPFRFRWRGAAVPTPPAATSVAVHSATTIVRHHNKNGRVLIAYWLLALLVGIGIMWSINVLLTPALNLIPFYLVPIYLVMYGFSPVAVLAALGFGGFVMNLRDEDITQGMIKGVAILARIVWVTLFGFWLVSGALATVPFEHSPLAFWYLLATAVTVLIMFVVLGWPEGHWLRNSVLIYAGAVSVIALAPIIIGICNDVLGLSLKPDPKLVFMVVMAIAFVISIIAGGGKTLADGVSKNFGKIVLVLGALALFWIWNDGREHAGGGGTVGAATASQHRQPVSSTSTPTHAAPMTEQDYLTSRLGDLPDLYVPTSGRSKPVFKGRGVDGKGHCIKVRGIGVKALSAPSKDGPWISGYVVGYDYLSWEVAGSYSIALPLSRIQRGTEGCV